MDNKYKFIGGFTVSDNYEAKKLKRLASRGWILEDIVGGMFYKFRKDKPQEIFYNIDYNHNADEEYFDKVKDEGWDKVLSFKDTMHIFASKKDNKEFTSELKLDRHITIQGIIGSQIKLWIVINLILFGLIMGSVYFFKSPFIFFLLGFLITAIKLITIVADYYIYHERIKFAKKYGNCKDSIANNKAYFMINSVLAIFFILSVSLRFLNDRGFGGFELLLGLFDVYISYDYYKKYKKSLESVKNI